MTRKSEKYLAKSLTWSFGYLVKSIGNLFLFKSVILTRVITTNICGNFFLIYLYKVINDLWCSDVLCSVLKFFKSV